MFLEKEQGESPRHHWQRLWISFWLWSQRCHRRSRPYQRSSSYWKAGLLRPQGQGLLACRSHYLRAWCLQPAALKMWLRCLQLRPQERRSLDFLVCQRRRATNPWSLGACSFGGGESPCDGAGGGFGACSPCPITGPHRLAVANGTEQRGPDDGPWCDSFQCYSGGPRPGEASSRTCLSLWELLHVGAEGTGSTHAASDFYHGLCGRFAPPGRQWHHVYGALRRFRPPPGLGPHPLPSDGGDGLDAGREPRGGEGRPGPIGRLHRPGCVMDGRRFDLAALLTLQEDPLSSIYINHQQSSLSRARAFSPLADQRWVTVALAFVKELGVILSKHLELTGAAPGSSKPQPSEAAAKSKPVPKKKGKGGGKAASSGQWPSSSGRGGGVADALPAKNQSMPAVSSPEGLEPNPLRDTMSFATWAICLPRWIFQSRSDFAWNLRRTFCFSTRQSKSLPTTAFPLPLPSLPEGVRVGSPKLSRRRFLKLCKARVLHVTVCALNQMYLGRFPTMDELGRRPNSSQQAIISRLQALIAVCGASNEPFPLAPGRSGPELNACLFQLEHFASHCPELQGSYT